MPGRPPKKWMGDCIQHVHFHSGSVVNPGAVCGSLWHHKMSPEAKRLALLAEKQKRATKKRRRNRKFRRR